MKVLAIVLCLLAVSQVLTIRILKKHKPQKDEPELKASEERLFTLSKYLDELNDDIVDELFEHDNNKNEGLDRDEFAEAVDSLFKSRDIPSNPRWSNDALFDHFNTNDDEVISREEAADAAHEIVALVRDALDRQYNAIVKKLAKESQKRFCDNLERQAERIENIPELTEYWVDNIYDAYGKSSDDVLTYDEIKKFSEETFKKTALPRPKPEWVADAFEKFDLNKNEGFERDELIEFVKYLDRQLAEHCSDESDHSDDE